nr:MAG TPA: hypothetical protein [Siphoviridae sp. ctX8T1]
MMMAMRGFPISFPIVSQIICPLNAVLFVAVLCGLVVNLAFLTFAS